MRYFFPDAPEASRKPTGTCPTCGYRREETRHVKVFQNWVCDLVQVEGGNWVHSSKIENGKHKVDGRAVVYKLLEDV